MTYSPTWHIKAALDHIKTAITDKRDCKNIDTLNRSMTLLESWLDEEL